MHQADIKPNSISVNTPSTDIVPFDFEGESVRIATRDSEPWFVLADVCRALSIANPSNAAARLDDDEKLTLFIMEGQQNQPVSSNSPGTRLIIVNESGLYSLILTSRKTAAKRFKKWVTAEVLPSIRKTGGYGVPADPMKALNDPAFLRSTLLTYTEKVIALEAKVEEMAPAVQALERIGASDGSLCITDAAKTLKIKPKELFAWMRANGWVYSRAGKTTLIGYQDKIQSGVLEHKAHTIDLEDGSQKTVTQVRVTPKGLARLAKEFPSEDTAQQAAS